MIDRLTVLVGQHQKDGPMLNDPNRTFCFGGDQFGRVQADIDPETLFLIGYVYLGTILPNCPACRATNLTVRVLLPRNPLFTPVSTQS